MHVDATENFQGSSHYELLTLEETGMEALEQSGIPANPRRELLSGPNMTPTGAGSFDFVRLRLHFAQDDRVGKTAMDERDNETSYFPANECTMSLNVRPRCS